MIESIVVQQFTSYKFEKTIDVQVSNKEGTAMLTSYEGADSLFFTTTHLQYNTQQWTLNTKECNPCIIKLKPEKFELPEIKVTAKDYGIRVIKDTVRFDLDVFRHKSQQDLKDLLKDLPGIEIRENDEILYNGRKIDKVLLSGKDVVKSQFDLVNRLVRKDIVETVQIVPGEKKPEDETPPQYLDIVLAKDIQTLAELGLGISHHPLTEQNGSVLFAGDRPLSSYVNVVRKSLDKPALSGGDAFRTVDIDIREARAKLVGGQSDFDVRQGQEDGIENQDILLQYNAQLDKEKHTGAFYLDYQNQQYQTKTQSLSFSPLTNQVLSEANNNSAFDGQSLSAYIKQKFDFNDEHKLVSFLSYDINQNNEEQKGNSDFLSNQRNHRNQFFALSQSYIWYNAYTYKLRNNLELRLQSDFSFNQKNGNVAIQSNNPVFGFTNATDNLFDLDYQRTLNTLDVVIKPSLNYMVDERHAFSLFTTFNDTRLTEKAKLLRDTLDKIFNSDVARRINNNQLGVSYNYATKNSKLYAEFGLAQIKSQTPSTSVQNAPILKLRYNYKLHPKLLWSNTIARNLIRFSNQDLFTSTNIIDDRSFVNNAFVEAPSFTQWSYTSVLRYLNTANGKIGIISFNYLNSSKSLTPLTQIKDNAQQVTYILAGAINQINIRAILNWPLAIGRLSANVSILQRDALIANENDFQSIKNTNQNISINLKTSPTHTTDAWLKFGAQRNVQSTGLRSTDFVTLNPALELEQFVKPKIWLKLNYNPILRINFDNQQVISGSIATKFYKDKLTLQLRVVDVLNFNNPQFIQRSIQSDFVRESITNRVGGYVLLTASYQFQ